MDGSLQRSAGKGGRRWQVLAALIKANGFKRGAELGVSTGKTTAYLCENIPDLHMICVDLWAPQDARDVECAETYDNWAHENHLKKFKGMVALCFPDRVTIHRMKTVDAAALVPDGSLDFVFIDADHTYEGCKADILAWAPKVRNGGAITGHDYHWPPVARVVNELLPNHLVHDDHVWIAGKGANAVWSDA